MRFDPTWSLGDVLTGLYLLATVGIFLGTVWAMRISRDALDISTKMANATDAAARASEALVGVTVQTQMLSRFQDTFFRMVALFQDIVKGMKLQEREGREVLQHLSQVLKGDFATLSSQKEHFPDLKSVMNYFISQRDNVLGHYFHTLYQLVSLVDRQDGINKPIYIKIIRAQLSRGELMLLFYYGHAVQGAKFRELMEKHGLLEGVRAEWLLDPAHIQTYPQTAFSTDR